MPKNASCLFCTMSKWLFGLPTSSNTLLLFRCAHQCILSTRCQDLKSSASFLFLDLTFANFLLRIEQLKKQGIMGPFGPLGYETPFPRISLRLHCRQLLAISMPSCQGNGEARESSWWMMLSGGKAWKANSNDAIAAYMMTPWGQRHVLADTFPRYNHDD